jgi:hypothetical protein
LKFEDQQQQQQQRQTRSNAADPQAYVPQEEEEHS